MRKTLLTALAFTLSLTAAQTARAWDPDPIRGPGNYTGVTRLLDVGFSGTDTFLAFTGDPGAFCAAQGGFGGPGVGVFGPAWLWFGNVDAPLASRWLSALMWAKSQNFQVRIFFVAAPGQACTINTFMTCSDAAACAYPPPAGP